MAGTRYCGLLIIMLALTSQTSAGTVQFEFSGAVEVIADEHGDLEGLVAVGDPFLLRYVFETTAPDQLPDDPHRARYGGLSAQLNLPNWQMTASTPVLGLTHWPANDSLAFVASASEAEFQIHLGSDGGILSSDTFPWPLPGFSQGHVQVYLSPDSTTKFWGSITVFPEPSTAILALLGAGAVCARRRAGFRLCASWWEGAV